MSKIIYPCETAAIFDDVIYPIHLISNRDIEREVEGVVRWFCRWCNEEKQVVKAKMLISFGGAYLTSNQALEVA